jgi:hypothetical protein
MQINVGEGLTASFYSEGDVWLHEKNVVNLLSQIGFGLRPGYRLSRGYPNVAELGGGEVGLHAGGAQGSGDEIEHVVCSLSLSLLQGEYFRDPNWTPSDSPGVVGRYSSFMAWVRRSTL